MEQQLIDEVYLELKRMAHRFLANEKPGQTLQTTALVHEAYLRLFHGRPVDWQRDAHFFGSAANAMRQILIEKARRASTAKRGDQWQRLTLQEELIGEELDPTRTIDLDAAMTLLESANSRVADVVKLRLYGGLTVEETSAVINATGAQTSERTVKRDWQYGRACLRRELLRGSLADAKTT